MDINSIRFSIEPSYAQFYFWDRADDIDIPEWDDESIGNGYVHTRSGCFVSVDPYADWATVVLTDLIVDEVEDILCSFEMDNQSGMIEFGSPDSVGLDDGNVVVDVKPGLYRIVVKRNESSAIVISVTNLQSP